jgi:hypothetical protein
MGTTHFADRNEPRVLIKQMTMVASFGCDNVHRPDSRIRFYKIQIFLYERYIVF